MSGDRFEYVTYIRSTPEKVWFALRDPEQTRLYWVETWQESSWEVGSPWKIMLPDGRVGDSGEVLEIDPPRRLVLSWRNEFRPELHEEGYSQLTYLLEPHEDAVRLTVTHEIDRPNSRLIAAVSQGWPGLLSSLKSLLEAGASLEFTRKWPAGA